jgi:hypothetical protein
MKLLKIDSDCGYFLTSAGTYDPIDKISKEDLLRLVNAILIEDLVEIDEFGEDNIKNQAHQIVYRSIYDNLKSLRDRKSAFIDESDRLYLEDYKRYVESTPP